MKTPPKPIYLQVKIHWFVNFPSKTNPIWKYITRIIYWSFQWPVTTLNSTRLAPGTSCKPAKRPARGPPHLGKHWKSLGSRLGAIFFGGCWIWVGGNHSINSLENSWPLYWSEIEKCLKMRWWDASKTSHHRVGRHLSKWHYATSDVYTRRLIQKCPQIKNLIIDIPQFFGISTSQFLCFFACSSSSSLALLSSRFVRPSNRIIQSGGTQDKAGADPGNSLQRIAAWITTFVWKKDGNHHWRFTMEIL